MRCCLFVALVWLVWTHAAAASEPDTLYVVDNGILYLYGWRLEPPHVITVEDDTLRVNRVPYLPPLENPAARTPPEPGPFEQLCDAAHETLYVRLERGGPWSAAVEAMRDVFRRSELIDSVTTRIWPLSLYTPPYDTNMSVIVWTHAPNGIPIPTMFELRHTKGRFERGEAVRPPPRQPVDYRPRIPKEAEILQRDLTRGVLVIREYTAIITCSGEERVAEVDAAFVAAAQGLPTRSPFSNEHHIELVRNRDPRVQLYLEGRR